MLGPLLFTLYVSPIADITQQHNVGNMFYADDTQLYVSISPRDINNSASLATLNSCLSAIKTWMGNNMLKLNDGKTELLLLGSPYFIKTRVTWLAFTQPQSRILGQHWVSKAINSVLSPAFGNRFQVVFRFVSRDGYL